MFISVNSRDNHQKWDDRIRRQEFIEILDTEGYLDNCAQYLPNTFQQAEKDIPRMVLKIQGIRIKKIADLIAIIPTQQLPFVLTACTQTLWGYPYEVSVRASQLFVHEKDSSGPCRILLKTKDKDPPFTIYGIQGTKVLYASSQQDIDKQLPPRYRLKIKIDMDTSITSILMDVRKRRTKR